MLGLQTSLESAEDSAEGVYKIFLLVVDLSENAVSTYIHCSSSYVFQVTSNKGSKENERALLSFSLQMSLCLLF